MRLIDLFLVLVAASLCLLIEFLLHAVLAMALLVLAGLGVRTVVQRHQRHALMNEPATDSVKAICTGAQRRGIDPPGRVTQRV